MGARIIAVADAYWSMTTDRPYRDACSFAQAVAELHRCAGTQFDPTIVDALEQVIAADPLLAGQAQGEDSELDLRSRAS